jgi:hypothetical protein
MAGDTFKIFWGDGWWDSVNVGKKYFDFSAESAGSSLEWVFRPV